MTDLSYTAADFARLAAAEFPELREELDEHRDLLHLQMHALQRFAQRAQRERDWVLYRRIMLFADRLWQRADDNLRNALNVSFLEHLTFDGPQGIKAWSYLSSGLQEGWHAMNTFWAKLEKRARPPRKQRPPKPPRGGR